MTLNGKRIAILGGSSGIGLAVAQAVSREGGEIIIASSRQASLDAARTTLPAGVASEVVDLSDEAAIAALLARLGPLDHLVYTAGDTLKLTRLAETDLAAAQRFWQVRYWGAVAAAKHAADKIRPGGSIVLTSGAAGRRPRPGWTIAASICTAMEGLTRALAIELAPLRVNLVVPGLVKTPLWRDMPETDREAMYTARGAALPVGHAGEPEEIAETYLYLMRQTYGTGQAIVVDGGGTLI